MRNTDRIYQDYLQILQEELIPAVGCTEPITVAYAAALGRQVLGAVPDAIVVEASGNMIKNVKCGSASYGEPAGTEGSSGCRSDRWGTGTPAGGVGRCCRSGT